MSAPKEPGPGPTGAFPLGKLNPDDRGEIRIRLSSAPGKIVLEFGTEISWLGFDPEHADALADALRKHAAMAREAGRG